jgi:integrase
MVPMASIERREHDWRVVWRQDGRKQHELFPSLEGAEAFEELVEAHGNRWPYRWIRGKGFIDAPSSAPTFGDFAVQALAGRASANERTRSDYLRDLTNHVFPTFGTTPVDRISRLDVGRWQIALLEPEDPDVKPPSAKTLKNVHNLASSIMEDAVREQLAPANPFRGTLRAIPTVKQEEMVFLTRGEFDQILSHVSDQYRPLALTLAHTGMRWSEATALQVHDVDPMTRRIRVVRAWKRTSSNDFYLGEPKSRRSRRTIVVSQALIDALLPLLVGKSPGEFVFTTRFGHPVRHNNFRNRVWIRAVAAARRCDTHKAAEDPCGCPGTLVKQPRLHDVRHSHASWLIDDRVTLVAIQRRLGHESITTTIDRYGHLMPDVDDEIGAALESWTRSALWRGTPSSDAPRNTPRRPAPLPRPGKVIGASSNANVVVVPAMPKNSV